MRTDGDAIAITATSAAHRGAMNVVLNQELKLSAAATSNFALRATESAEAIIGQLTASANKTFVVEDTAIETARTRISVIANATSIETLVDEVARQAGLATDWNGDTVVLSLP